MFFIVAKRAIDAYSAVFLGLDTGLYKAGRVRVYNLLLSKVC